MKKISFAFVAIGVLWQMPVNAASFDCTKASSYAELTICSTPSLSSLDEKLNALYRKAMTEKTDQATVIKKAQLLWLKNVRNKATTAAQLTSAYNDRISDLQAVLGTASVEQPNAASVTPPGAPVSTKTEPAKPVGVEPAQPARQPSAQGENETPPTFPAHTAPVTQSCSVTMQYGRNAKDKYITGKKNDPYRIRVTDSGDSFVIHFDQYYGLGDKDSGSLSLLGKDYLNIKGETDGITSYYLRPANAKFSSYRLKSTSKNETELEIILYGCHPVSGS